VSPITRKPAKLKMFRQLRKRIAVKTDKRAVGIFGALLQEVRFARDSLLEERGFELLVPP
jgi:hypothetical protein